MATRNAAVGTAPKSTTASRMKRKELPQMAASSTKSRMEAKDMAGECGRERGGGRGPH
ncbi:hypothetical protein [Ramlibacter henchirensis]|uniref:hypothetical protein n=1 Tax=Ramlibacter henchirensis TaxID=204072 RepID=UPI001F118B3B|nr:hypothetical protein [Ramlibacter henchirensis]